MATSIGNPPVPLPPNIPRYDAQGRPTRVQVEYERRVLEWITRLAALVPGAITAEAPPVEFRRRFPLNLANNLAKFRRRRGLG